MSNSRGIGWGVGLLVAATLLGGCVQTEATPEATPGTSAASSSPATAAAGRAADLDHLVQAFVRLHPDPPDLRGRASELQDLVRDMTPEQLLVEVMRLTAGRPGDGHTGVFPVAQPELALWPLQLYAFDDGWRVVAAMEPHTGLVGGSVTEIGGVPVEEAAEAVAPLVPRDNDASLRGRLPQYLVVPDVLEGLGLESSITVDGQAVVPVTVTADAYAEWQDLFDPLVCPPLPRPSGGLWGVDERDGAVVVRYRRTVPVVDGRSGSAFAADVLEVADGMVAPRLLVDVRDNPGGENAAYAPLLDAVQQLAARHPGSVHVLVNRCTFSAASQFVAEVVATTDAVVVGETMGGSARIWGDARPTRLPASGIVVHIASRWHDRAGPEAPTIVEPDIVVPVTWTDHDTGSDRAIDAALGR